MKKVFMIHGFEGEPNGGWRPWLMAELAKHAIYACALPMPSPNEPIKDEWVKTIKDAVGFESSEVFLVGHSLGVPAILRYLETVDENFKIDGIVLVSGPCEKNNNPKINNFFEEPFNFNLIKSKVRKISIIHGDNDSWVPFSNAQILSKELGGKLITIKNGGHLGGTEGHFSLPEALAELLV